MEKFGRGSGRISKTTSWIKKEALLLIALGCAIITSFFHTPKLEYIDFRLISLLFCLMVVVCAYRNLRVLDLLAVILLKKCTTERGVQTVLVLLAFFTSMIITNDVALLTFVPLTLIISRTAGFPPERILVFQTLAANLGSSVTPMGNPQNLFLFSFYHLSARDFFSLTGLLGCVSLCLLFIVLFKAKKTPLKVTLRRVFIADTKKTLLFTLLLIVILLSVFRVLDYTVSLGITLLVMLFFSRNLFVAVDYSLLVTFACFFIFIGNLAENPELKTFMQTSLSKPLAVYFAGIGVSQIISNVPAAILLSEFTPKARELILGVNIGGLGTLIASLASVITFKLHTCENPPGPFLKIFTLYNLIFLFLLSLIFFFYLYFF